MQRTVLTVHTLAELGEVVRRRRKAARLTLDDAAALLGVGRRFLVELENGKRRASIETVLRVLHGLGLELRVEPRTPHSSAAPAADDSTGESR
jgi:transcriptional regulator with XRE-family HTH domain